MMEKIPDPTFKFEGAANEVSVKSRLTPPFMIRWEHCFDDVSSGLRFEEATDLKNGVVWVNASRNAQMLEGDVGRELCKRIRQALMNRKDSKEDGSKKKKKEILPYHITHKPQKFEKEENLFSSDLLEAMLASLPDLQATKRLIFEETLLQPFFREFIGGSPSHGMYVVAVIGDHLSSAINNRTNLVYLSGYTVAKNKAKHKIDVRDYHILQEVIDRGIAIKERRPQYGHHINFFLKKSDLKSHSIHDASIDELDMDHMDKYWNAVVKGTSDGSELYLQTLHLSAQREVNKAMERGLTLQDYVPHDTP
eukprot:TRINITY_DN6529_c0_g1_i2.p1 TRINITY_DN6529_c0_g1~~TRINITY_DN6529_c0_g1_i2.p1  ORF type:complete len:308 (+),score=92.99 TRINITY_DN6529_c0_g1_i2:256-1179(+)